jgi:hypothetical protein
VDSGETGFDQYSGKGDLVNDISKSLKPLVRFDYGLVGSKIAGLSFNLDRDLRRRMEDAEMRGDRDADRCLTLLNVMLRFAYNSYETVLYIAGDMPEDLRRKPNYVLVVPNINRQLLDLLFSLVYMMEDFRPRSLAYQKAGWRDTHEEMVQFKESFAHDPEWATHFAMMERLLEASAERHGVTEEEKKNPKLIRYWNTPYQFLKDLRKKPEPCAPFLEYLNKWLYKDVSAHAHLTFGGLFKMSPFLIAEMFGKEEVEKVNDRPMKLFHFTQLTRTALSFLAIATEIDTYCHFGNEETINYIWTVFNGYAAEAKELWDVRYRDRLNSGL